MKSTVSRACKDCGVELEPHDSYRGSSYCKRCHVHRCGYARADKVRAERGLPPVNRVQWKVCALCGLERHRVNFRMAWASPDGLLDICEECRHRSSGPALERIRSTMRLAPVGTKVCRVCKVEKPYTAFQRSRPALDGYRKDCRACCDDRWLRTRFRSPEQGMAPEGHTTCGRCRKTKPLSDFGLATQSAAGLNSRCQECDRDVRGRYAEKHPEVFRESGRRTYARDRSAIAEEAKYTRAERRAWWDDICAGRVCEECGEDHPGCPDFHHRDPKEKVMALSAMVLSFPKETLLTEIAKCRCLCSNCHRKLHWSERRGAMAPLSV